MRKIMSYVLAFTLVFTMGISLMDTEKVNAASYKYTRTYIFGGGTSTSKFSINGMVGLCQHAGPHSTSGGTATVEKLKQSDVRTQLAYYYGQQKSWTTGYNGLKLARAFNYVRTGKAVDVPKSTLSSMVSTAKKQTVPERFRAYLCTPGDKSQSFIAWKLSPAGYVRVLKKCTNSTALKTGKYSLAGIKFGVYRDNKSTLVDTLVTASNGYTPKSRSLPAGKTYYIRELSVPADSGLKLDQTWHKFTVPKGSTLTAGSKGGVTNEPKLCQLHFKKQVPAGKSMAGFSFKFELKSANGNSTLWSKTVTTGADGKIDLTNLLAGKYIVTEQLTTAQLKEGWRTLTTNPQQITLNPGDNKTLSWNWVNDIDNEVQLIIKKTTSDEGPVSGFKFHVTGQRTNAETGETETFYEKDFTTPESGLIIIKDEDLEPGEYTVTEMLTEQQQTRYLTPEPQTNTLEENIEEPIVFEFENVSPEYPVKLVKTSTDGQVAGISFKLSGTSVFGEQKEIEKDTDENGNIDFGELPPGEYIIEETGFDAEKYLNLDVLEGYTNPAKKLVIPKDAEENETFEVTFNNVAATYLAISKVDGDTANFLTGATFEIKDSNDEVVCIFTIKDKDGKHVAEITEAKDGIKSILEEDVNGDLSSVEAQKFGVREGDLDFSSTSSEVVNEEGTEGEVDENASQSTEDEEFADADDVQGFEYVVIAGLKTGEKYTITEIESPEGYIPLLDPATITMGNITKVVIANYKPDIKTTALDSDTKEHISNADENVTLYDTVEYSNLTPGKEYTITGTLMDKETGKALKDSKGNKIESEPLTFTADSTDGKVKIKFVLSAQHLKGKTTVVFESLEYNEKEVASHADLGADSQTVHFPKIKTKANLSNNEKEVKDKVSYKNLIPGKQYEMKGWLVTDSGKKIKGTTVTKKFTPDKADGHIVMTLDARKVSGKAVVFEECYLNGKLVGEHKDVNDKHQTIEKDTPTPGDNNKISLAAGLLFAALLAEGIAFAKKRKA